MRTLILCFALAAMTGCASTHAAGPDPTQLSPEFTKAGKYTYSLIDQAWMGQPALKTDVTRALAELESVHSSVREGQIHTALYLASLHVQDERYDVKESGLAYVCLAAVDHALRFSPALASAIPDTFAADYDKCVNPPAKKGRKAYARKLPVRYRLL